MICMTRYPSLRWPALLAAFLTAALVIACGGGGVDTGGTGAPVSAYSSGRVTGFGSIVVNDVHYDESGATITDDAGRRRTASELQLGMTVEVEAGEVSVDSTGRATSVATRVQFASHIAGPVESVDAVAGTLRVLGQTVDVDLDTVLHGFSGGLASVSPNDLVEVYAFLDPTTGRYAATRLEQAGALSTYKLRGRVTQPDTVAQTFAIGDAIISYAGIEGTLPQLANGTMARVELQSARQAGVWVASRLHTSLPVLAERVKADIEGYVTDFASLADFRINGTRVDASGTNVVFRRGNPSQVADGVRIEVEGRMQDGVLVAERVTIKKAKRGNAGSDEREAFVLEGRVGGRNLAEPSFSVRGVQVVFDDRTRFEGGTADTLDDGDSVVVTGRLENGNTLRATEISIK
jgi:cytochrome c-type biogenesis protein CcmE